ncbi:FAD-dependent oxidoreductase [Sphingomonas aestuarii]
MEYDLLVVGGGINGCAIAREAAVNGLSVLLVEKDDLASHTSSASTKLIHGGLRYLETYEFKLVHEALYERERLIRAAPHLIRPMVFVLPHDNAVRPWWMVRAGLYVYDLLGGRSSLPRSRGVRKTDMLYRTPLRGGSKGFVYSECVGGRCAPDAVKSNRCRSNGRSHRHSHCTGLRSAHARRLVSHAFRRT